MASPSSRRRCYPADSLLQRSSDLRRRYRAVTRSWIICRYYTTTAVAYVVGLYNVWRRMTMHSNSVTSDVTPHDNVRRRRRHVDVMYV